MTNNEELLRVSFDAAIDELKEFCRQDDYLLAHGASLMSEDSHEIVHVDTLRRVVEAVVRSLLLQPQTEPFNPWKHATDGTEWTGTRPLNQQPQAVPDEVRRWVKLFANWEYQNGTLAAIQPSEYGKLIERIQDLAVDVSPRRALEMISAAPQPAPDEPATGDVATLIRMLRQRAAEERNFATLAVIHEPPHPLFNFESKQRQEHFLDAAELENHAVAIENAIRRGLEAMRKHVPTPPASVSEGEK